MSEPDSDFGDFFGTGYRRLVVMVQRIVGDPASAEDVAAEAFARAYAAWRKIGPLEHRLAWVLRVATNLAIDSRRAGRRWVVPLGVAIAQPEEDPAPSIGDEIAVRQALVAALRELPRRQREAVALRYLGDLPVSEVAVAMHMAPGTVKTHLHRGLTRLRGAVGGAAWNEEEVRNGA